MKNKFSENFNSLGTTINFLLSIILGIFPLIVVDFGDHIRFIWKFVMFTIILFLLLSSPIISAIVNFGLWIAVVVQCINGTITGIIAVISYILFTLFIITKVIAFISGTFATKNE